MAFENTQHKEEHERAEGEVEAPHIGSSAFTKRDRRVSGAICDGIIRKKKKLYSQVTEQKMNQQNDKASVSE